MSLILAAGVTACGEGDPQRNPAAPTAPQAVGTTPPGSTPRPAAPSTFVTVSGTVFEHTEAGVAPLAGVPLLVYGYHESLAWATLRLASDADGRYQVPGLAARNAVFVRVDPVAGYRAPCPPSSYNPEVKVPLDVHVASQSLLSATGAPASMPVGFFTVLGRVTERIGNDVLPVGGASVDMFVGDSRYSPDIFEDDPDVQTMTAADGRYWMCAIRDDFALDVRVRKAGYRTTSQQVGNSWTADMELVRE